MTAAPFLVEALLTKIRKDVVGVFQKKVGHHLQKDMGCCSSEMVFIADIKYLGYGEKDTSDKDQLLDKYTSRWNCREAVVFDKNDLQLQLEGSDTCCVKYGNVEIIEYLDKYCMGGDNEGVDIEKVIKITLKKSMSKLGQCIYFGPMTESELQQIKDIVFKT